MGRPNEMKKKAVINKASIERANPKVNIVPLLNRAAYIVLMVGVAVHLIQHLIKDEGHNIPLYLLTAVVLILCWTIYFITIKQAGTDFVTGLPFRDKITHKLVGLSIKNRLIEYTGVFINLKNFRHVNQIVGMGGGNYVLRQFADSVQGFLINGEYVARLGGDNFFVLLYKHRTNELLALLDDLHFEVEEAGSIHKIQVRARCGIFPIQPNSTINDVYERTSMAVAYAKAVNKEDYVVFRPEMLERSERENQIAFGFYKALENHEFKIYYQPKVNVATNEIFGCEALVRWEKDGEILMPSEFSPILEKRNMVVELDYYVLEQVCEDINSWIAKGIKPVPVSSNFSRQHLRDNDFADRVVAILDKHHVDYSLFEVEFTESNDHEDFEAMQEFIEHMSNLKITTSIDDFGIGYSSLELLKNFNFNTIKLDRSFINGIEENDGDNENYTLLRNIIRMCREMKKEIICEGVENSAQARLLGEMNCSNIQGYLYDKPLRVDEFEKRLVSPVYKAKEE